MTLFDPEIREISVSPSWRVAIPFMASDQSCIIIGAFDYYVYDMSCVIYHYCREELSPGPEDCLEPIRIVPLVRQSNRPITVLDFCQPRSSDVVSSVCTIGILRHSGHEHDVLRLQECRTTRAE